MSKKYPRYIGDPSRDEIFHARGYTCEWCRHIRENDKQFRARPATDLHHALFRRDVRRKELNVDENYMIACHRHHMEGVLDTPEFRKWFWGVQCDRYGEAHMLEWLDSLESKFLNIDFI